MRIVDKTEWSNVEGNVFIRCIMEDGSEWIYQPDNQDRKWKKIAPSIKELEESFNGEIVSFHDIKNSK